MKQGYDTEFKTPLHPKTKTKRKIKKMIRRKAKGMDISLHFEGSIFESTFWVIASGKLFEDLGEFNLFTSNLIR